MTRTNGQWVLASRPEGMIAESNFEYKEEPVREIEDGEVLVRNLYLAFEPAMRGWVDDVPSYIPPVAIGEVMRASTVGQVIESKFEIDRTEAGMRNARLFGEFFRLQCAAEAERNIKFKKLPEARQAIEECIETSASSKFSFQLCLLDSTVIKESWEDYYIKLWQEADDKRISGDLYPLSFFF